MSPSLSHRIIFRFWAPLAGTWLLMAVEGPFIAGMMARMPNPEANLATYGLAFAFALILEAPIMMLLSAGALFIRNEQSFKVLLRFSLILNGICTLGACLVVYPPIYKSLISWLAPPQEALPYLHKTLVFLIPWPGAIGLRRFYQGFLISLGQTKKITWGTTLRVTSMLGVCLILPILYPDLPGSYVGACALSSGVCLEALGVFLLARPYESSLKKEDSLLTLSTISRFYVPLALTSCIALAAQPMITFFLGKCSRPLESLAVMPVINGLVFVFRGLGLSFQEAALALLGPDEQGARELTSFSYLITGIATAGLVLLAFTPLSTLWFQHISGLSQSLADLAHGPLQLMVVIPLFAFQNSLQRALAMRRSQPSLITWAMIGEVSVISVGMFLGSQSSQAGALVACGSVALGRVVGYGTLTLSLIQSQTQKRRISAF
jgi:hypothetical protein